MILVVLAGLALSGTITRSASRKPAVPLRFLTLTYLATVQDVPPQAREVRVWVPLASTRDGQRILHRSVHAPGSYTITREPAYGNELVHLVLKGPVPEPVTVQIDYEVELGLDEPDLQAPSPAELGQALEASGLIVIDDEVRARARQATAGRNNPAARARGIYDDVIQHMVYDKRTPGWGRGDTRRACLLGRGNCADFHSLFIAMARAVGIPARFKIGLVVPEAAAGEVPGYHCWAEFYVEGRGWSPVDASEAWKHPALADYYFGARAPNRFLISVGRDLRLVPPQQGEPVNLLLSPYVEVDGRVFDKVNTEFRFQELPHGQEDEA